MQGKRCIVTGGNAGIGKETAIGLAKQGAEVIIVSRNQQKGEEAVEEIKSASGNENVSILQADFSSLASVRKLAEDIKSKYDRLDVLVNNAGAYTSFYNETEDGFETLWQVNHLAPFLLTNLLLDLIKSSVPARIVNVSSDSHYTGIINFDDLGFKNNYDGFRRAYAQSKLANVLFTYELSRRLEGTGVVTNALHPGVVKTEIAQKNANWLVRNAWGLMKLFMITPEQGAATSIHVAADPVNETVTGKFFAKSKQKKSSKLSYDLDLQKKLWALSEQQVGLS